MNGNFWKDKRVLVTGHTGFKGGWLMNVLAMLGARAYGYSDEVKPSPSAYDIWAADYKDADSECLADIADLATLKSFVDKVDPEIVFHMAAQPLVLQSYEDPLETVRTNILGTANLLETCRNRANLKSVVIITSDKVYDASGEPKAFDEGDRLGGKDLYSASKACCELVTDSFRHSFFGNSGTNISSARAGNVIGGGDWSDNRLIPDLIRAAQSGETCQIRNSASTRPWQHVLEPLKGYMVLAEKMCGSSDYNGAWNFGPAANSVHDVKQVADTLCGYFDGLTIEYGEIPENAGKETKYLAIQSAKAEEKLGWSSRLSFDKTIEHTCRWYAAETDAERKSITEEQISGFWEL